MQNYRIVLAFCGGFLFCNSSCIPASEPDARQLMPDSTVGYIEVTGTASLVATICDHPISLHVQAMDIWKTAEKSEAFRNFLTGRKFFEIQIGSDWRPALEALTAGGIFAGFDAATQGAVLLVKTKDDATAENFRLKILELTKLNESKIGIAEPYRDVQIYKLDKHSGAAVVGSWIIWTNNGDLGKSVLNRLLDETETAAETEVPGTLSANAQFKTTYANRNTGSQIWAYGNVEAVRNAGAAKKILEGKAENPLVELLVGGIQSVLQRTPHVVADVKVANSGISLRVASPYENDWIPEEREYYFGTENQGVAPKLPDLPGTLLTLSTYRDVSQMWLRAGDLFDEQMNDKLAEAESGLSTIFAGRDFGEEVLGAIQPQIGLIVTRQDFSNVTPVPALKLPGFALLLKLRDAENMRPELRRTFQSVIGFFNIVGAMEGRPQLELDIEKLENTDIITTQYIPEKKDRDSTTADMIFNFSPSAAFSGDRFILASTAALARQLAAQPESENSIQGTNTSLQVNSHAVRESLEDNREQLISQNMLSEGHSRAEAEAAIGLLFEAVQCVNKASIIMSRDEKTLALQVDLIVNENP